MGDTSNFPIPPASFSFLIESILMQAQMQLGLFKFGQEDEGEGGPNLPLARHSIDMLAVIQEKTRGNLSSEEQRLVENGLTELRYRFVQVSEEQKRKGSIAPQEHEPEKNIDAPGDASKEDNGPRIIMADGGKGTKSA